MVTIGKVQKRNQNQGVVLNNNNVLLLMFNLCSNKFNGKLVGKSGLDADLNYFRAKFIWFLLYF